VWQRGIGEEERTQPGQAGGGKALLVNEYPEDLHFYSTILEAYGYEVRRCSSYHEGVRCLGDQAFDFVIVSQGTPNFEGSWVLMRATEANPSLPVLVVARCLNVDCYEEAMQLGALDYLVEPLTAWEVGRLLEKFQRVKSPGNGSEVASRPTGHDAIGCRQIAPQQFWNEAPEPQSDR
jgi:DNA-binding NtrC family response regulator